MIKNVNVYLKRFIYKTIIDKNCNNSITNIPLNQKIYVLKMLISKLSFIYTYLILMPRSKFVYTSMQTFKTHRWVIFSF